MRIHEFITSVEIFKQSSNKNPPSSSLKLVSNKKLDKNYDQKRTSILKARDENIDFFSLGTSKDHLSKANTTKSTFASKGHQRKGT